MAPKGHLKESIILELTELFPSLLVISEQLPLKFSTGRLKTHVTPIVPQLTEVSKTTFSAAKADKEQDRARIIQKDLIWISFVFKEQIASRGAGYKKKGSFRSLRSEF